MAQLKDNITFRMEYGLKENLKEYSHSIGLTLPELIEAMCTHLSMELKFNSKSKELVEAIAKNYIVHNNE